MTDINNEVNACLTKQANPLQKIAEYSVIHEQVVPWGDMDAFNHVNN